MGVIKTALEIALERTESVKSDKSSIEQFEAKRQGKKLANAFLAGETDLAAITGELKKASAAQSESLKNGIFDVLLAQIALPEGKEGEQRLEAAGKGLQTVIDNKEFSGLFGQLAQILSQYTKEAAQYEQAIRRQYEPRLRQKEEELARRLGREVHIDPMQDPEFAALYSQHINALKSNYNPVIEQAREEIRRMFEA